MKTVSIATLGCKVNQFESEVLTASLEKKGYCIVPFGDPADIQIINTCTVTHRADFQSRQMVRRASRCNPDSLLVVTGCYAEVDPERLAKIEGVHQVVGNVEKVRLPDLLPSMEKGEGPTLRVSGIEKERLFPETPLHVFRHHTRAFLKIQDGCDARCSYCVVPFARGRSRSLSPEKVVEQTKVLKTKGFKEVVLTGIHIGAYGRDLHPPSSLESLLDRAERVASPDRIRLSSIEPIDFSPRLISFLSRSMKVCPHLHVPIQSGDDEILKRMERGYDRTFISQLLRELVQHIPTLCLGADVIVGFPGETEQQFEQTKSLIESLPIAYLHVFPFSRRKGTPASQFPERVEEKTVTRRAEILRELGRQKRLAFYRTFLHQQVKVLVEDRRDKATGTVKGLSRNYIPILLHLDGSSKMSSDYVNREVVVRVTDVTEDHVVGRVTEVPRG